jgi:hypothetical protein
VLCKGESFVPPFRQNHAHDLTRFKNKDITRGLVWLAEAGYRKTSRSGLATKDGSTRKTSSPHVYHLSSNSDTQHTTMGLVHFLIIEATI